MSNKRLMEIVLRQLLSHLLAVQMQNSLFPHAQKLLDFFIERIVKSLDEDDAPPR
jgi:hypothetical protein